MQEDCAADILIFRLGGGIGGPDPKIAFLATRQGDVEGTCNGGNRPTAIDRAVGG